ARIYGYNKIESRLPRLAANTSSSREESNLRKLVNALLAQGCNECITYSFVSPEMNRTAGKGDAVALRNPFGEETSVMRTSLLPSMLKVVKNNLNSGNSAGRLFELGRIYTGESEPEKLCIALFGKDEDFYTLKGVFEAILAAFKLPLSINSITRHTDAPYHPGRAAACDYVVFGEISPLILAEYDIDTRVYAAEIDIAKFFAQCENKLIFTHLPKYPDSVRDLSLVCTQDTASGEVIALIEGACKAILQRVEFFDVFELSDGQKSLSYKLTFRKADGTLTSDEVEQGIGKILKALEQNNIKLRS
ncbi:MAG: phenylalanine--tRNA ligase subunit beta, partial [Oscillospiraceae bacterium]|nr:phenylalanine--tRNA ligase subunit beta [Oscillospiraceae bacterium]